MPSATVSLDQQKAAGRGTVPVATGLSVVLPARNEEENIRKAVESLAAQPEVAEIVVVDDHSTDRTGEILRELARQIPRLRIIRSAELPEGWIGKNRALAAGVQETRGDWLLFTDADVRHLPGVAAQALAIAAETGAALVSFSPEQEMRTWWERTIIPRIYCALARQFSYKVVSDPANPAAAANGQFLLIRRDAYQAVGGHAAIRAEVLDDVVLAQRVKQAGYRLYFAPGVGIARTRMYHRFLDMWRGWTKNLFPLLGHSSSGVLAAVVKIVSTDLLPAFVLAGALVVGRAPAHHAWLWAGAAALLVLVGRHVTYAVALGENRFPLSCISYYEAGSILFGALLIHSAWKYWRGRVEWKGREYAV